MTELVKVTYEKYEKLQAVLMQGDISKLSIQEKVEYTNGLCESLGLNPLTKPFDVMKTKEGKEVFYANKNCAEQLRSRDTISIQIVAREIQENVYVVVARAVNAQGRQDESIAAVPLYTSKVDPKTGQYVDIPLAPVDKANSIMKCETKAKRRVTLSICGLGMLDESEVDDNPQLFTKVNAPAQISEKQQEQQPEATKKEFNPLLPNPTVLSVVKKYAALHKIDQIAEKDKLNNIYSGAKQMANIENSEVYIKSQFEKVFNAKTIEEETA